MACGGFKLLVPPRKVPSPAYSATTVLVPALSDEVLKLAAPPLSATGSPAAEPLIRNCTTPVGTPLGGGTAVTVAVKVTFDPMVEGFAEDDTATAEKAPVIV